ncbi:MAG: hypothetical protein ACI4D9_00285 [Lachnospiraceae bacterium]
MILFTAFLMIILIISVLLYGVISASTTYDKEIDDEQQMLFLSQRNKSDHAPDTEYEDNSSHK